MRRGHNPSTPAPPSLPPGVRMQAPPVGPPPVHTYMLQRHRMTLGSPLTFSDGERIVAVVGSAQVVPGLPSQLDVTVLVEVPSPSPAPSPGERMPR